jgi:protoporphyrin/coproporphyrin ferrochelatase
MKTGILLINLGTPEAADAASVRRYLKEFVSDPRVIEKRGILWWMILNLLILPHHSKKSAAAYARIWNHELDESPLKTVTRSQANKTAARFGDDPAIMVEWAMRYGAPSIASGLKRLTGAGCEQVLLFPLYPQYSGTTTGTALDKAYDALMILRHQPALRTVPPYYDNPDYIHAIASDITAHIQPLDRRPDHCLVSFHGLP